MRVLYRMYVLNYEGHSLMKFTGFQFEERGVYVIITNANSKTLA